MRNHIVGPFPIYTNVSWSGWLTFWFNKLGTTIKDKTIGKRLLSVCNQIST